MNAIAVVHLVRRKNGIGPFEMFLHSYLKYSAGLQHDLVIIFKGFPLHQGTNEYDLLLAGIEHKRMFVADYGYDLVPYFKAVNRLDYHYFCFLNSFSRILQSDWLVKLHSSVSSIDVGLAGATGSYESFSANSLDRERAMSGVKLIRRLRLRMQHILEAPTTGQLVLRLGAAILRFLGFWDIGRHFPTFPNQHIRTNALMASREVLLRIRTWPILFKLAAYALESGNNSLTNQVLRMGLRAVVVSSSDAFDVDRWHCANVFRQGKQEDLLVADNQTDLYINAIEGARIDLSKRAWGKYARPNTPDKYDN